jgi:hypothetical protein
MSARNPSTSGAPTGVMSVLSVSSLAMVGAVNRRGAGSVGAGGGAAVHPPGCVTGGVVHPLPCVGVPGAGIELGVGAGSVGSPHDAVTVGVTGARGRVLPHAGVDPTRYCGGGGAGTTPLVSDGSGSRTVG